MRFSTLEQWLRWQEQLHPKEIELGLDRLRRVLDRMALTQPAPTVITVGGTNGKGSTVALLEAILRAGGYRAGVYSSPHLRRYNERVRVDGTEVSDQALCQAFQRVDEARQETSLTYFEFGTLAALEIFRQAMLDVVILEVGLGGRLDAVNAIDADLAIVTSIDLDHMDWLGPDRDSIGREKAGIMRSDRPGIFSGPHPPSGFLEHAPANPLYLLGRDFYWQRKAEKWQWQGLAGRLEDLPLPALVGEHQLNNAAGVIQGLRILADRLPVQHEHLLQGLQQVSLPGRFQRLLGPVERIFDVAHNPAAAQALAANLNTCPVSGTRRIVLAMLADKDAAAFVKPLLAHCDQWYLAGLTGTRGRSAEELAAAIGVLPGQVLSTTVAQAYQQALADSRPGDRILVTGSFHTVAEALAVAL